MARRRAGTTAKSEALEGRLGGAAGGRDDGTAEGRVNDGENGRIEDGAEARYAPSGGRLPTNCDASGAAAGDPY